MNTYEYGKMRDNRDTALKLLHRNILRGRNVSQNVSRVP